MPSLNRRLFVAPNGKTYPIVEATDKREITVTGMDVDRGIPHDPFNCAIAQACRRSLRSPEAMVGGAIAYIVSEVGGEQVALKYMVPPRTRDLIDLFDLTGEGDPGTIVLKPLKPSWTRKGRKKQNQRRRRGATIKTHASPYQYSRSSVGTFKTIEE